MDESTFAPVSMFMPYPTWPHEPSRGINLSESGAHHDVGLQPTGPTFECAFFTRLYGNGELMDSDTPAHYPRHILFYRNSRYSNFFSVHTQAPPAKPLSCNQRILSTFSPNGFHTFLLSSQSSSHLGLSKYYARPHTMVPCQSTSHACQKHPIHSPRKPSISRGPMISHFYNKGH